MGVNSNWNNKKSWFIFVSCKYIQQNGHTFLGETNWREEPSKDKHNAELQRTDPGTKVEGEFSIKGRIFHQISKMDFYYLNCDYIENTLKW